MYAQGKITWSPTTLPWNYDLFFAFTFCKVSVYEKDAAFVEKVLHAALSEALSSTLFLRHFQQNKIEQRAR